MKQTIDMRSFDLIVASRNYTGNKAYSILDADRLAPGTLRSLADNHHALASFQRKDAAFMFVPNQ